jgi:hypothetical protein
MKKKRDAKYYAERLKKESPGVFAEIRPGGLSVRAASAKAGLVHLPTPLGILKREWKKASLVERREFVVWLKAGGAKASSASFKPIADKAGRLRPEVRKFLSDWVKANKSKPGRIMKSIGFKVFDPTLSQAIYGGHWLRPAVIPKLASWLTAQGYR